MFKLQSEQWVLLAALLLLGGGAVFAAFNLPEEQGKFGGKRAGGPEEIEFEKYNSIADQISNPPQLQKGEHRIFVDRLYAYKPKSKTFGYVGMDVEMDDGITPRWKIDNDFPLADPNVATMDPDKDGFTNKEEYDKKTNPRDKADAPSVLAKLKVEKYTYIPFGMKFASKTKLPGDKGYEYGINLLKYNARTKKFRNGKTIFVKEGDKIGKYVVKAFRPKTEERMNESTSQKMIVDVSELDVFNPVLNQTVTLVFDRDTPSDESKVTLNLLVPKEQPEPKTVAIGKTFKLRGVEYQLRSAKADRTAIILDLKGGTEHSLEPYVPKKDPKKAESDESFFE